ncbi:MAG: response regulator [Betaproteobacteria bacterium]|nr:response regulator [Betaproteobacteria bacterium]
MDTRPIHILLVEDDDVSRKLIHALLSPTRYALTDARDLTRARVELARRHPDAILLDVRLGDGNGLDLAREVRSQPRFAAVPILAITAQALVGDAARAIEAGADAYLAKPIDTREFVALLDTLVRKHQGHAHG